MTTERIKYRDWEFEIDKELTSLTYKSIEESGADSCICNDCKNYVAYRENVFPKEIKELFTKLGIDYKKEVEVSHWEKLDNGLFHIGGWFHFKGKIIKGKIYKVPLPGQDGFTFDLTRITENFSIGFAKGNDLTFFDDKDELVQIEFDTNIPWIIDENLKGK